MFLTKNFFYMLIAKVAKKSCKKMFKTWIQNRFLLDAKPFYLFFILKLNLSKDLQMFNMISFHGNFYKENEESKPHKAKNQRVLCDAKSPIQKPL